MVNFKESKSWQKWLEFAEHDLKIAISLNKDLMYTDTICHFCHQTAEKTLKAYLLFKDTRKFPHLHNLTELLNQCAVFSPEFNAISDDVVFLKNYYIETKYPPDFPINYSRDEATEAIKKAEDILDFVKKKLNK